MDDAFRDRVALVTGGGAGIGRALCLALGAAGARVHALDLDGDSAAATAAAVREAGGEADAAPLDVTDADAFTARVDHIVAQAGRVDLLFNNAGIAVGGEVRDIPLALWERVVNVNLWGVVHGVRAAYPHMVRQRAGHIVNTASLAGLTGCPTNAPYAATKAAVINLSHSLRAEGEAFGVRCSVVCPGFVDTGFFTQSPVVQVDREAFLKKIDFRKVPVEQAVQTMLRGVARNRATIVFPAQARLAWRLGRLSTALLAPFNRSMVKTFREARTDAAEG